MNLKALRSGLIFITLLTSWSLLFSQNGDDITSNQNAGLGQLLISHGVNYTKDSKLNSSSIGGEWAVKLNYIFKGKDFGVSTSLTFELIHLGTEEGYVSPDKALEFKTLSFPFEFIYAPDKLNRKLMISAGYAYGIILDRSPLLNNLDHYNPNSLRLNCDYSLIHLDDFVVSIGMAYRNYNLGSSIHGRVNALLFRLGIGINGK